ncbi:unnamed protein product [Rotaria sp. Silwood1]|nr:unnamed protein product [Rotaria sp. Silwood1]CAF3799217.1 unnamed protein product [Rotaria sp. Silwood1]CAF3836991.1 unnamed protein product [Rotaria sp. Silwood1]CAF4649713.1 unnamed protein product [Rotaria sp. Silwood1]CAF4813610.1 unnamed protein product [Rotaria sp. Silwood1]
MSLNGEELEYNQHHYAILAYQHYRAAAREFEVIADEKKSVELETSMARSLYQAGDSYRLEAQIYAIIGIFLLVTSDKNCFTQQQFQEIENLRQKICCIRTVLSEASLNIPANESLLYQAVMNYRKSSITLQQFKNALLSELRFIIFNEYSHLGISAIGTSTRITNISNNVGIGISYLIGDILLKHECHHQNQTDIEKSKIRERINKIMKEALDHYTKEQYVAFLYSLTVFYAEKKILIGIKECRSDDTYKISLDIRPGLIVKQLLYYEFSPEGIANFLLLIGEVLLSAPQLKSKNNLTTNIRLELPKYSDFIHFATLVFDEILKNTQLIGATYNFDSNMTSRTLLEEKSRVSAVIRLKEVQLIAKINYAIVKLISGGIENLQESANMIKSVKGELAKDLIEEKIYVISEIRLQALTDILAVFGFNDDTLLIKNETIFFNEIIPQLGSNNYLRIIKKVLVDDGKVSHCEPVIFDNDDDIDEFTLLDQVLSKMLRLDKTKFVRDVRDNYYKNVEPLKSLITEIISREHLSDIKAWKTSFLKEKYSFTFQYLPILSVLYNLIFIPCTVEFHREHKLIFVPDKKAIDLSNGTAKTSIYVLTEIKDNRNNIRTINGIFVAAEVALNYISNQLELASDPKVKVDLLNQIADYHRHEAEKIDKTHHLESLKKWIEAQKYYNEALTINRNHLMAMLGYATCLIKLNKYTLAEKFLIENAERKTYFRNSSERWYLLGILKRKLQNYDEAKNAIENAFKLKPDYIEAQYELELILRLKKETIAKRMHIYKKMTLIHAEPKSSQYNILSIDGGGIRGLIPAMWMSELERRTGMSSSSMFHMMAGTSTGAIIAAGLSLPNKIGTRQPRYKAADIVELYTCHSNKVFTRAPKLQSFFGYRPIYLAEEKKALFDEYFGDIRLSQTLTELIITAVNSGSSTTELFRHSESSINLAKDYKLSDILMCTTAAPTYFPPYNLNNLVFVDGGVQANNPTMIAYSKCPKNINRNDIFVLSLGTGDYVPDPLHPNSERNLLFWAVNNNDVLKVIFDGPQNNIDYQLSNILDSDKYHRWQIWLEKPIILDDVRKETLDRLMELAHAHFEEMDTADSKYRLGKLIERLKDT